MSLAELNNSLEGGSSNKMSASGFFNHIFNFDNDNKSTIMNMLQYIILGLIPVVLVLKTIKYYVPEEDDNKGTTEITIEVALQLFTIFFAIWFIDRMVRYVPTYSGINYHKFNEINFILPLLIILVTMQTKLGAKINILADRVMQLWEGREGLTSQPAKAGNDNVKVSQPLAQQQHQAPQVHVCADNMAMNSTPISQLPMNPMNTPPTTQTTTIANNMMANNVQSNQMPMQDVFEPVAANDGGAGMFSSW